MQNTVVTHTARRAPANRLIMTMSAKRKRKVKSVIIIYRGAKRPVRYPFRMPKTNKAALIASVEEMIRPSAIRNSQRPYRLIEWRNY